MSFGMLFLSSLLFAGLSTAQLSGHIFGILKQTTANPTQFVVAPYCSDGEPLSLIQGLPSAAQTFSVTNGLLLGSADGNVVTGVRICQDGLLVFGPIENASAGFAIDDANLRVVYKSRSQFCALNGQIYLNSPDPGCEAFNLKGIEYFHPGTCASG